MKKVSDKTRELLDQIGESVMQDWDLDEELIRDCFPLKAPYRNQAGEALLTVEVRMKKRLSKRLQLNRSPVGTNIIDDARRLGVFKRSDPSEEQGIELLFRGSVLGIRNVLSHNKPNMSKEEAIKIILFADYLIKLFETQCKNNKI
ncbi:MAG: TIGR02391 family protein [Nitrosopumilaceae archaeon]